ncbi:MAG: hypothetical protein LQ346_004987 [Caloplaca aetnensis]|nr:MAG: hypothetical protein LQ346_004987 [Caloplaca aetnensis]
MTSSPQNLSKADKDRLLHALRSRLINTLPELRRIERIFAALPNSAPDTTAQPMQTAWLNYVDSHSLLNELRGLTRHYPFSSACLDEAKASAPRVSASGNFCWRVLKWVRDQLLAAKPAMWGGKTPSPAEVGQLAAACESEWTRAVTTLLRHWDASGA